jgi:uncharacterized protein (DUF58 family)
VFKGRGMEFDEVRPYVPGDDVRSIDWNVTARTGEPYVKRFVEERELTVMLLCDVSHSQDFGSGRRSKLEAAVELCALLALSAVESGDKVGLLLFHGGADLVHPAAQGRQARAAHHPRGVRARPRRAGHASGAAAARRRPAAPDLGLVPQAAAARPRPPRAARPASPPRSSSAARCCRGGR